MTITELKAARAAARARWVRRARAYFKGENVTMNQAQFALLRAKYRAALEDYRKLDTALIDAQTKEAIP